MKLKVLFLLAIATMLSLSIHAQRGVRIGYIDTEYILQNVPEYAEATTQLETKVQKWKGEIEEKYVALEKKRVELNNEKALLTKELVEEREEDLNFEEKEILDYQQKRFGPDGDLMKQKKQLIQPIQDQIFQAVQDIAKAKKYDFVFDKVTDVVMLYGAKRLDISERVLRTITRASKRNQLNSKADKKAAKDEDLNVEVNEGKDDRQKALDEKKAARKKVVEDRRKEILRAREAKKKELLEAREKKLKEREAARQAKIDAQNKARNPEANSDEKSTEPKKTREEILEERRQKKLEERAARKKELEEKRKKILEDRKKAKENKN
jgi:Skp family chaperone for outer membrane proteins